MQRVGLNYPAISSLLAWLITELHCTEAVILHCAVWCLWWDNRAGRKSPYLTHAGCGWVASGQPHGMPEKANQFCQGKIWKNKTFCSLWTEDWLPTSAVRCSCFLGIAALLVKVIASNYINRESGAYTVGQAYRFGSWTIWSLRSFPIPKNVWLHTSICCQPIGWT